MSIKDQNQTTMQAEIGELAHSVNQIVNKFKLLQAPLAESNQIVPQATQKLDKISEQTEAATHLMLDKVEAITGRQQEIIAALTSLKGSLSNSNQEQLATEVDLILEKADCNCNDVYILMDALQFQDITSQQLNHAASLMEEIESKLQKINSVLSGKDSEPSDPSQRKERSFDPEADLLESKTDQAEIDSLFEKKTINK